MRWLGWLGVGSAVPPVVQKRLWGRGQAQPREKGMGDVGPGFSQPGQGLDRWLVGQAGSPHPAFPQV